jgi:anti-sigma B factor antagonist
LFAKVTQGMRESEHVELNVETVEGALIVRPRGEIDLGRSPSLRQQLTEAMSRKFNRMVIDLSDVPYMDSSGVATLVEAMQQSRRSGSKLVLCGMQDKVRSIFEIARLDTVFTIVADCEEARSA